MIYMIYYATNAATYITNNIYNALIY